MKINMKISGSLTLLALFFGVFVVKLASISQSVSQPLLAQQLSPDYDNPTTDNGQNGPESESSKKKKKS